MSANPEGVLFWGYTWPEDSGPDTGLDRNALAKRLVADRGVPTPNWPLGGTKAWVAWNAENAPAADHWRRELARAEVDVGADWGCSGSWEYLGTYLYADGSRRRVEWTEALPVTSLEVDPDWRLKIDAFLAQTEVDPPVGDNQPGWWLVTFYG